MLISVDPGKYATKSMSATKRIYFPTRISPNPGMETTGNTYHVEYQGSTYIIGEQAEQSDFDISKASLVHKISAYTAITQLQEFDNHIQLVLGCPLNVYKNRELRDAYKAYIMNERFNHLFINSISYGFYLDQVLVIPEGAGIVYMAPNLFKGKRVAVIDVGGFNFNFAIYDSYIPQVSSMFTLNMGGYELQNTLLNTMNTRYGIVLNNQDIPHIIAQSGLKIKGHIDNESIKLVDSIVSEYLGRVLQEVRKNGFNLDVIDTVFVGGTSKLLESKIRERVPHAFIPHDAEWANCQGFYEIGAIKFETA